jgi:hypothetical protein
VKNGFDQYMLPDRILPNAEIQDDGLPDSGVSESRHVYFGDCSC